MNVREQLLEDSQFSQRYELLEVIGEGGMGEVYRGFHKLLNRPVAIKLLLPSTSVQPKLSKRFRSEARLAGQLSHPCVVAVYDYGQAGDVQYLVMELVTGQSLDKLLAERGTLSVPEILSISRQVLAGLAAIHELEILHRDLKPQNILISDQSPPTAKITDFGIAKGPVAGQSARSYQTTEGHVLGTPLYMAPEQFVEGATSPGTDLYSFTLILYRMALGQLPFPAESLPDILRGKLEQRPAMPPRLWPPLADLISRGLARDPEQRFATAGAYARAFENAVAGPESTGSFFDAATAPVPAGLARARTRALNRGWVQRIRQEKPRLVWPVLAAIAAAVCALAVAWWPGRVVPPAPAPVPAESVPAIVVPARISRPPLVVPWQEIEPLVPRLRSRDGAAAAAAAAELNRTAAFKLGSRPQDWLYLRKLSRWLEGVDRSRRAPRHVDGVEGTLDDLARARMWSFPAALDTVDPAVFLLTAQFPGDSRPWVILGRVLQLAGHLRAARLCYREGLYCYPVEREGSRSYWAGLATALWWLRPEQRMHDWWDWSIPGSDGMPNWEGLEDALAESVPAVYRELLESSWLQTPCADLGVRRYAEYLGREAGDMRKATQLLDLALKRVPGSILLRVAAMQRSLLQGDLALARRYAAGFRAPGWMSLYLDQIGADGPIADPEAEELREQRVYPLFLPVAVARWLEAGENQVAVNLLTDPFHQASDIWDIRRLLALDVLGTGTRNPALLKLAEEALRCPAIEVERAARLQAHVAALGVPRARNLWPRAGLSTRDRPQARALSALCASLAYARTGDHLEATHQLRAARAEGVPLPPALVAEVLLRPLFASAAGKPVPAPVLEQLRIDPGPSPEWPRPGTWNAARGDKLEIADAAARQDIERGDCQPVSFLIRYWYALVRRDPVAAAAHLRSLRVRVRTSGSGVWALRYSAL